MKLNLSLNPSSLNAALSILFITLATACAPSNNMSALNSGAESDSGIIGGTAVAPGTPLQKSIVLIYNPVAGYLCSGSLLPNNFVLTAAHCISPNPRDHLVLFTTSKDSLTSKEQVLKVGRVASQAVVHSGWVAAKAKKAAFQKMTPQQQEAAIAKMSSDEKKAWNSDLGLIKFVGTVPEGYAPASLATPASATADFVKPGAIAVVAGYGVTKTEMVPVPFERTAAFLEKLQHGEYMCKGSDAQHIQCFKQVSDGSGTLYSTELKMTGRQNPQEVVLNQSEGHAVCSGDSGGPAYIKAGNQLLLWGVASRVTTGCNVDVIYTDITSQFDWLKQTMAQLSKTPDVAQAPGKPNFAK
jgi:hypothetical protein